MSLSPVSLFRVPIPSHEEPLITEQPAPIVEKKPVSNDTLTTEVEPTSKEKEDLDERVSQAVSNLSSLQQALPVLSAIGALSLASPEFKKGFNIGSVLFFSHIMYRNMTKNSEEVDSKLDDSDLEYISKLDWGNTVLTAPVLEELIFRGGVQGTSQLALSHLFSLFSDSDQTEKIASIAAIILTSALFGAVHMTNGHSRAKAQSISAAIGSIPYGFMRERFGLISSIGAHMANNFWVIGSLAAVSTSEKEPKEVEKKETS